MLTDWRLRLRSLFRRARVEEELDEEVRFHLEQETAAFEALGLSRAEAMRRARLAFGSITLAAEEHRDARGVSLLAGLGSDLKCAVRYVRRSPTLALMTCACLGLGVGINTAVFSVISAALLRPLAVADPDRLLSITRHQGTPWSYGVFDDVRSSFRSLDGLAASLPMESDVDVDGNSEFVAAEAVSSNYGQVVRPTLRIGHWFTHDREGSAVISEALWERHFNRDPRALGRVIRSQSESYVVVGVMAREFTGVFAPIRTDLWVPVRSRPSLAPLLAQDRPIGLLMLFGRLSPGATAAQASAELRAFDQRLPSATARDAAQMEPLIVETAQGTPHAANRRRLRTMTTLLGGVVATVLLIACVNVGNLLLARGAVRQREFAVRRALGASRTRVVRQLLLEGCVFAAGGCLCGVLLAVGTIRLLSASLPSMIPVFGAGLNLVLDWGAVAFAIAISVVAVVVSNVLPARIILRMRGLAVLRGDTVIRAQRRPFGTVAQVALSLVLLLIVGSFIQRLVQLQTATLGFSVNGRIYAYTFVPSDSTTAASRVAFYARAIERLQALPGVTSAALTSAMPLMPTDAECVSDPVLHQPVSVLATGPRYFDTLGIEVIAGHDFRSTTDARPQGLIVNQTLAQTLWHGESAVGRSITVGCTAPHPDLVVGVVRDSVVRAVGEAPKPQIYRPFVSTDTERLVAIIVNTAGATNATVESIRRALLELGDGARVYATAPLAAYVAGTYGTVQWTTETMAAAGLLALFLAIIGVYGVMSYRVVLRTREIGVRMALGANRGDIFRQTIAHGAAVVLIGLAVGELVAMVTLGGLASLQDGVHQPSLCVHAIALSLWVAAGVLACYTPAARAAGMDPLIALRRD